MATRRIGSTKSIYDIALGQMRQRTATGQPSLPSGFWNDALYAANLAELESARGEESREEELAFRREQFETQGKQFQQQLAAQQGQFGEQMAYNRESKEKEIEATKTTGYAQLAVNAPMTYLAAKQLGLFGATTGVAATGVGTTIGGTGTGLGVTGAHTPVMGAGGSTVYAAPATTGAGAAAGPSLTMAGGAGAVGGYVGAKYGPFKKESGEMATFGMGGEKEKKSMGGALRGAGAGALAGAAMTSWSGPGALVGMAVGAIVGFVAESDTVICTELARQGYIEQEYLDLEQRMHWDFATYWGYRILADPFVTKMKTSKLATLLILPFAKLFLKEVAHRVEPTRPGSLLGSLLIKLGVPLCREVFFYFVSQNEWPAKYKLLEKIQAWKEN